MWKKRLSWRNKPFLDEPVADEKSRIKSFDGFVSSSSLTTATTVIDDSSLRSHQLLRSPENMQGNEGSFESSFRLDSTTEMNACKNSFDNSEASLDDFKASASPGESLGQLDETILEFVELPTREYSRENLIAHGFTYNRAKLVRMLSSNSLNSEAEKADMLDCKQKRTFNCDELSVVHSVGTFVTQSTGESESLVTKLNAPGDFNSKLAEKLEQLPTAELVDRLIVLSAKLKKVKKSKKKKKSSRRRKSFSDLENVRTATEGPTFGQEDVSSGCDASASNLRRDCDQILNLSKVQFFNDRNLEKIEYGEIPDRRSSFSDLVRTRSHDNTFLSLFEVNSNEKKKKKSAKKKKKKKEK
jgi:hypothetical protein